MTVLLFQWSHWDYKYLQRALGDDCQVIFSKDCRQRVLRYLSGSVRAIRASRKGDTIVCWYDVQAVLCWWMCHLSGKRRNIVCLNILLKQKKTLKNRMASFLFRRALVADNFMASVTSVAYGEWLNGKLGIEVKYTLLHDVYHDYYEMPELEESPHDIVFCGGCYGRDWPLMLDVVKAVPEVKFYMVMTREMKQRHFGHMREDFPANVKVLTDIPYQLFMRCLCQSKIVCMPLDCEAPQGLIVMFEAAANGKLILTSDTPTTEEYFGEEQRLGKDVEEWRERILYYLSHDEERKAHAAKFRRFVKEECGEQQFAKVVKGMADSFARTDRENARRMK